MTGRNRPATGPDTLAGLVLGAATVSVGLIAGFFFDWAVAIMPGLGRTDDQTFVAVMWELIGTINSSGPFLVALSGGLLGTLAAAVLLYRTGSRRSARWALAALGCYLVALLITFGVHFPLHESLGEAATSGQATDLSLVRDDFEAPWVTAHLARTVATGLALAALARALWLRADRRLG